MNFWDPFILDSDSEFYKSVYDFARDKVLSTAEHRDENCIWDDKLWKELSKAGLAGLPIPSEFGGQDASCYQCCLATEAFSAACIDGGFGLSWAAHMIIGAMPIVFQGNSEQKNKYLPKLASGEWIAGLGLTEASAGSDAGSLITRAEPVDGGYLINGSKMYITNGPVGQVFIIMARTGGKSRGPMGVSAFIVDSTSKGFTVSKILKKLGHHTSMTAELIFENMFVPEENLLGPLNSGFMRIGKATLEWERTVLIAGLVGAMEYTLNVSLKYSNERIQFDKPISSFSAIQEKIVRNWIWMNSARILIHSVAESKDQGHSKPLESSVVKVFTSEVAEDVAKETIQLFGGYGFMKEFHIERFYRDVKLGTIGGGTSEIQRSIIAATYPGSQKFIASLSSLSELFEPENMDANSKKESNNFCNLNLDKVRDDLQIEIPSKVLDFYSLAIKAILDWKDGPHKQKSQAIEFAFADFIIILLVIDRFIKSLTVSMDQIDISNQSEPKVQKLKANWYTTVDQMRDLGILMEILIEKYFHSLRLLASSSDFIKAILRNTNQITDWEKQIGDCYFFLNERK
ncbi:acyl-CoA dehydrogenase family protein [Leptospira sp. GIMC2001]|uniref:acyl-CoA dehydrogenase family protein n=1 Tax=Leptospira sp. GIMC2001 TaxID=1513297 RepID=UPI00234B9087|nr:acyl-CoA dehydrogenase family protein [Leptospira sp. GIMC2001]WCL50234.1 acyl-CoA/acyl-ACP dehydrogenase [Leptospira sp. GIMC2001]